MFVLPMLMTINFNYQSSPKDVKENFISLRDYDFVGEDKRLASILAEHMAVLAGDVNLTDISLDDDNLTEEMLTFDAIEPPNFDSGPDQFELKSRRARRINVSMDYAEMFNITSTTGNESDKYWFGQPSYNHTTTANPGNLSVGRRAPTFRDPSFWSYTSKILDIMKQHIYMVQQRFIEIEPIIKMHEDDVRFRMAYIFSRLDEWKKDIRTLYYAMKRFRKPHLRFVKLLYYYEHVLRKNIDITYTVEYLIHLHTGFMTRMDDIIPRKDLEQMQKLQKMKKEMQKSKQFNKTALNFLKLNDSEADKQEAMG